MTEDDFSKVLVFCPHPDDGEFTAGGSMAKWASQGKEVVLCVVTNGAAGSNDPDVNRDWLIETRIEEQKAAAAITGISDVIFLGYEDGHVEDSNELRRDMIREMRRFKPDLVVCNDPTNFFFAQRYINHPDHRKVGEAFLAAVNPGVTTVPLYREELYDKGFLPHPLKACYLGFTSEPDHFVDISDQIEKKVSAIMAHVTQMGDSFDRINSMVRQMGSAIGAMSGKGYAQAEGFRALYFDPGPGTPTGTPESW